MNCNQCNERRLRFVKRDFLKDHKQHELVAELAPGTAARNDRDRLLVNNRCDKPTTKDGRASGVAPRPSVRLERG
jgi:hypothetical protein